MTFCSVTYCQRPVRATNAPPASQASARAPRGRVAVRGGAHGLAQEQGEDGGAEEECSPFAQRDGALLGGEGGDKGESDKDKEKPTACVGRGRLRGAFQTLHDDEAEAGQRQAAVNADLDKIQRAPRQNRQGMEVKGQGKKAARRTRARAGRDRRRRARPGRRR